MSRGHNWILGACHIDRSQLGAPNLEKKELHKNLLKNISKGLPTKLRSNMQFEYNYVAIEISFQFMMIKMKLLLFHCA
uniref:Uncharacterized protein n=1 Tax=Arundo donax TaxID=35708 RepID=A0A0A9BB99_ARUDO